METPVLKNSRDLWNLVCDVWAKSCPNAAYFRVWIEMDFILDDIWILTSRSRWVPTWRTSWFRMVVRLADENYPSWGINYDEPSMTTPSSHVEVANSPWPARSNVPSWVTRIISARFCWVVWHRSELSFFEKKNSSDWTVLNSRLVRCRGTTLKSHGSNPSHWDPNPSGPSSITTGSWDLILISSWRRIWGPRTELYKQLIWFQGNYRGNIPLIEKIWKNTVFLIFFMLVSNIGSYHGSLFVSGLFLRLTPQPRAEVG